VPRHWWFRRQVTTRNAGSADARLAATTDLPLGGWIDTLGMDSERGTKKRRQVRPGRYSSLIQPRAWRNTKTQLSTVPISSPTGIAVESLRRARASAMATTLKAINMNAGPVGF
jgi:hypothetical protein